MRVFRILNICLVLLTLNGCGSSAIYYKQDERGRLVPIEKYRTTGFGKTEVDFEKRKIKTDTDFPLKIPELPPVQYRIDN